MTSCDIMTEYDTMAGCDVMTDNDIMTHYDYESSGFMVRGPARPHIVSRFGTENGEPVDLVED